MFASLRPSEALSLQPSSPVPCRDTDCGEDLGERLHCTAEAGNSAEDRECLAAYPIMLAPGILL